MVGGRFVYPAAARACESCVELRLCESDDARWASTAHPGGDRRIYTGVFGIVGGAALGKFAGDRNVGRSDVGAWNPGAHSFGQWPEFIARSCGSGWESGTKTLYIEPGVRGRTGTVKVSTES